MLTFCGYLYIFIRTSSYKQKHNNILILFGEDPWQRIKKIIEPTKKIFGDSLGRAPWRKPKKHKKHKKKQNKKTKETKPIGDPVIPMVMFFLKLSFLFFVSSQKFYYASCLLAALLSAFMVALHCKYVFCFCTCNLGFRNQQTSLGAHLVGNVYRCAWVETTNVDPSPSMKFFFFKPCFIIFFINLSSILSHKKYSFNRMIGIFCS